MSQENRPKAVICDDEFHIREMLKALMQVMNVEVAAEAANANEAVEAFRRERPDLMLLDINLPGKKGDEVLKEIMGEFPEALIIMLTSVVDMDTVNRCLDLGAANYLLKDTPIQEMQNIIKETWDEYKKDAQGDQS